MHNTLHGADADAQLGGDLLDAFALSTRGSDLFLDDLRRTRPSQGLTLGPRSTFFAGVFRAPYDRNVRARWPRSIALPIPAFPIR